MTSDSHFEIRARANNDFVRWAIDGLENWLESLAVPGLEIRHNKGTHHSLYLRGRLFCGWYITRDHIRFWFKTRRANDEIMHQLSSPSRVLMREDVVAGNMANERDFAIYQEAVRSRLS